MHIKNWEKEAERRLSQKAKSDARRLALLSGTGPGSSNSHLES
jgi:hypothetical protein